MDELGTPPLDGPDPGELTCEKCGTSFSHKGRGRKPKTCLNCRGSKARPSSSTTGTTEPKRPRGIDQLERAIHGQLAVIGAGLMFFDPFDAKIVLQKAEKGAKALANLAATNPAIRRSLEKGVELAGWGPVALWATEVTLPILAHHGLIRGVPDPATKPETADDGAV